MPGTPRTIRVWDAPVRLFHWLLVALIAFSWWSGERHAMEWHRWSGYGILAVLIFRIYWGIVGGRTARFAQFVRGPRATLAYARALFRGEDTARPGHNPLGGWSVMAMLAALAAMVGAGLFAVDVDGLESGPLADYVTFDQGRVAAHFHALVFNVLLALIALHILAILFHLIRLRHDLIDPMIHDRRGIATADTIEDHGASLWKALPGVALAALAAYLASRGLRL